MFGREVIHAHPHVWLLNVSLVVTSLVILHFLFTYIYIYICIHTYCPHVSLLLNLVCTKLGSTLGCHSELHWWSVVNKNNCTGLSLARHHNGKLQHLGWQWWAPSDTQTPVRWDSSKGPNQLMPPRCVSRRRKPGNTGDHPWRALAKR